MRESVEKSNSNNRFDNDRKSNFKKKSPKHGKMGPVKKDKYKNSWND